MVTSASAYSCANHNHYTISANDGVTIDFTTITEGEEYKGTIKVIDSNKYIGRLISATLDDANDTNITEYCAYTIDANANTASLTIPKEYTVANISVEVRLKDNKDDYEVAITSKLVDDEGKPIEADIYLCKVEDMTFTETPIYFNSRTTNLSFAICTNNREIVTPPGYDYMNFLLENVELAGSTEIEKLNIKLVSIQPIALKSFVWVTIDFNGVVPIGDLTADVVYNRKNVILALNDEAKGKWKLINNSKSLPEQEGDSLVYSMKNFSDSLRYSILVVADDDESKYPTDVTIEHTDYPYITWNNNPLLPNEYGFNFNGYTPTQDCAITLKCIE